MKIVIFLICVVIFYFSIKRFRKLNIEFDKKRKKFVEYLDTINDIETLKRIGEINMFGVRERWYPRYTNLVHYLEYKIYQTNDDNFKTYLCFTALSNYYSNPKKKGGFSYITLSM